jgi:hypothetical protein
MHPCVMQPCVMYPYVMLHHRCGRGFDASIVTICSHNSVGRIDPRSAFSIDGQKRHCYFWFAHHWHVYAKRIGDRVRLNVICPGWNHRFDGFECRCCRSAGVGRHGACRGHARLRRMNCVLKVMSPRTGVVIVWRRCVANSRRDHAPRSPPPHARCVPVHRVACGAASTIRDCVPRPARAQATEQSTSSHRV